MSTDVTILLSSCHVIQQRQPNQPMNEKKFKDIVKRLEEGLLRSAVTKVIHFLFCVFF